MTYHGYETYLEYRQGNSNKFYVVYQVWNNQKGLYFTTELWGRIGTGGKWNPVNSHTGFTEMQVTADNVVTSKRSKGYTLVRDQALDTNSLMWLGQSGQFGTTIANDIKADLGYAATAADSMAARATMDDLPPLSTSVESIETELVDLLDAVAAFNTNYQGTRKSKAKQNQFDGLMEKYADLLTKSMEVEEQVTEIQTRTKAALTMAEAAVQNLEV